MLKTKLIHKFFECECTIDRIEVFSLKVFDDSKLKLHKVIFFTCFNEHWYLQKARKL